MSPTVNALSPPGKLGEAIAAEELLRYQAALADWITDRRAQLDSLDAAAQHPPTGVDVTADVLLAMSMWQSVSTKTDQLRTLWDSGRADAIAREQMSRVIWGRLDGATGSGSTAASLAESTTLTDALIGQLRERLAFDPDSVNVLARLRAVRASVVRCEDLAAPVEELKKSLDRVSVANARGADVAGPLAELEAAAAKAERDAIVTAARRHEAGRDRARAVALAARLEAREPRLVALAARCREEVAHPPKLAVPDVSRLGDPPSDPAALAAHIARLERVARAMDTVEAAYATPLRMRASLRYRLSQAIERASGNGREASPTVRAARAEAEAALDAAPCELVVAADLVDIADQLSRPLPHVRQSSIAGGPS